MADNKKANDQESSIDNSGVTAENLEKVWVPIRPEESRSRVARSTPASRASSMHSMARQRSHNYWSCDENIENDGGGEDQERGEEEKDPFEVGWEDGERDPLNPRSKGKTAKWAIVLICSLASLCVYAKLRSSTSAALDVNLRNAGLALHPYIHQRTPRSPPSLSAPKLLPLLAYHFLSEAWAVVLCSWGLCRSFMAVALYILSLSLSF